MTAPRFSVIFAAPASMLTVCVATPSAANDQYSRLAYAPPIWTGLYVGVHLVGCKPRR